MPKTVAIIDGNSLMHRAFHAVPPAMQAPDGTPTNAAFGFLAMLIKFIEEQHPDAIGCAFDKGKPAFRMEALEQYKAQRPPMDDNLRVQFPLIEDLLAALNIPVVALPGWEGDDILGTLSGPAIRMPISWRAILRASSPRRRASPMWLSMVRLRWRSAMALPLVSLRISWA